MAFVACVPCATWVPFVKLTTISTIALPPPRASTARRCSSGSRSRAARQGVADRGEQAVELAAERDDRADDDDRDEADEQHVLDEAGAFFVLAAIVYLQSRVSSTFSHAGNSLP